MFLLNVLNAAQQKDGVSRNKQCKNQLGKTCRSHTNFGKSVSYGTFLCPEQLHEGPLGRSDGPEDLTDNVLRDC